MVSDRGDDDRAVCDRKIRLFQDLGCQKGTILRMGMPVDRISNIMHETGDLHQLDIVI